MIILSDHWKLTQTFFNNNQRLQGGLHNGEGFCKRLNVCTLALYFQLSKDFPLIVAANRDEHYDRPSAPPMVFQTEAKVLAGRDIRAGGSWLGVNEHGLLAAVLNRRSNGSETASRATRSRGLLCLDVLGRKSVGEAREFVTGHREAYQPFTLAFADPNSAYFAFNNDRHMTVIELHRGLHVFNNAVMHDEYSEKKQRAYGLFGAIDVEEQRFSGPISCWVNSFKEVLSDHTVGDSASDPREAICVHGEISGTVSSSVIVFSTPARQFRTVFCSGAPCQNDFNEMAALDTR
jgi:uncharacterized protein with NRDE domain